MARPTDAQVEEFTKKLRAFRGTLPEDDQRLLDAMYHAAMGTHEAKDDDTHAYWVAAGPRGVAAGPGFAARPWGVAYGTYYPAYW
jgi:hypothetical protein